MSSDSTSPVWNEAHLGSASILILLRRGRAPRIVTVPRTVPGGIAGVGTTGRISTGFGGGSRGGSGGDGSAAAAATGEGGSGSGVTATETGFGVRVGRISRGPRRSRS